MTLVMDQQVSLEWMVALGCSLRGINGMLRDKEINLSGEGAIDTFHREQLLNFITLWRVIVPVVLGCLVIVFALADNFLTGIESSINVQPTFNQQEMADMEALEASSTAFNQSIALVANAEAGLNKNYLVITEVENAASANGITITHLYFPRPSVSPSSFPARRRQRSKSSRSRAPSKTIIISGAVSLPLANIQGNNGGYTFSMTFPAIGLLSNNKTSEILQEDLLRIFFRSSGVIGGELRSRRLFCDMPRFGSRMPIRIRAKSSVWR